MTDLGTLGGTYSTAYGINDGGTIVGNSRHVGGNRHAFSYDPGTHTMTDLGTLGGDSSTAHGINDAGTIVGDSDTAGTDHRAFMYTPAPP